MRVLIADDQPSVCSAFSLLLAQEANLEVVGQASSGQELGNMIRLIRPELLLLDWELPGLRPADLARLPALLPGLRIVALSSRPEAQAAAQAAGVDAFISKGDHPEAVLVTLRALVRQGTDAVGAKGAG